jgi:hypothetical protein
MNSLPWLKPMRLILYSKPGCHLCEGLQEKLEQVQTPQFELEVRDITTRADWFQAYQYEIPVLLAVTQPARNGEENAASGSQLSMPESAVPLPRISPRASVQQVEQVLQKYLSKNLGNGSK